MLSLWSEPMVCCGHDFAKKLEGSACFWPKHCKSAFTRLQDAANIHKYSHITSCYWRYQFSKPDRTGQISPLINMPYELYTGYICSAMGHVIRWEGDSKRSSQQHSQFLLSRYGSFMEIYGSIGGIFLQGRLFLSFQVLARSHLLLNIFLLFLFLLLTLGQFAGVSPLHHQICPILFSFCQLTNGQTGSCIWPLGSFEMIGMITIILSIGLERITRPSYFKIQSLGFLISKCLRGAVLRVSSHSTILVDLTEGKSLIRLG